MYDEDSNQTLLETFVRPFFPSFISITETVLEKWVMIWYYQINLCTIIG